MKICCRSSGATRRRIRPRLWTTLGLMLTVAALAGRAESPDPHGERPNHFAIARLIEQLGSNEFPERERASQRLGQIGEPAVGRLRAAVKSPDLEVRFRARDVLQSIHHRLYSQRLVLEGHGDVVVSVAVSPDGRRALSGSNDGTIRLWDLESGKQIRRLHGHRGAAWAVAFSPDGRYALGGGKDGDLSLYRVASGEQVRSFARHPEAVRAVAFTPDGRRAFSACFDKNLRLWDVESGKMLRQFEGHKDSIMCVACSPDGRSALTGGLDSDRTVRLWDVETGRLLHQFAGHGERIMSVAFSPDGRLAASGSWDATVRLWDLQTGKELRCFRGHKAHVYGVLFSPSGKHLISGDESGALFVWDAATGEHLDTFEARHNGHISGLALSGQRPPAAVVRRRSRRARMAGAGVMAISFHKPGAPATGCINPSLALRACERIHSLRYGLPCMYSLSRNFAFSSSFFGKSSGDFNAVFCVLTASSNWPFSA